MATTITASNLTVTVGESIKLNGYQQGSTNVFTIPSITEISKRIISIPTSEIAIVNFGTASAAGQFIESDVKYIRITNKDSVYHVTLVFKGENNEEFAVKLDYGQSFIYNADLAGGVVDTFVAAGGAVDVTSLVDLVSINAKADTAAVDVEIFIALT